MSIQSILQVNASGGGCLRLPYERGVICAGNNIDINLYRTPKTGLKVTAMV